VEHTHFDNQRQHRGKHTVSLRPVVRTVITTDVPVHMVEWGRAGSSPTMVLLHGLAHRWQAVLPLVRGLAGDWHVIAADLRGHGRSGRAGRDYSIRHFGRDTAEVLASSVAEPAVIYGHSLGGLIALALAAEHPRLVRAVIAGDSAIFAQRDCDSVRGVPPVAALLGDRGQTAKDVDDAVMDAFRSGELFDGYDAPRLLRRIKCPTLLLQADPARGAHMDDLAVRRALTLLDAGQHVRVTGVGHQLQLTDRGTVLDAIRPFLRPFVREPDRDPCGCEPTSGSPPVTGRMATRATLRAHVR
jgi:pimeloyl-ACP methyl ester carboxylesterase